MIYTSSYNEVMPYSFSTYSISADRGKSANYNGLCYPKLAPKKGFWRTWKDNIGIIPAEENNLFYVQEYWKQVLSDLDPKEVYSELDGNILLCYEKSDEFCHRHIVAEWFELLLGVEVKEVVIKDSCLSPISRPSYIKDYLEQVMKENINMHSFKFLRDLNLLKKADALEKKN